MYIERLFAILITSWGQEPSAKVYIDSALNLHNDTNLHIDPSIYNLGWLDLLMKQLTPLPYQLGKSQQKNRILASVLSYFHTKGRSTMDHLMSLLLR